jgi:hypothetical protein
LQVQPAETVVLHFEGWARDVLRDGIARIVEVVEAAEGAGALLTICVAPVDGYRRIANSFDDQKHK